MSNADIDQQIVVTELWEAAHNGDVAKLQELLAIPAYKDIINTNTNSQGHSALFFACYGKSNAAAVRLLLNAGADPFQRDNAGAVPLHFAANSLDPDIITALLEVPGMYAIKLDPATGSGQTTMHALFLSGAAISSKEERVARIAQCIPFFLKRDENPLSTLRATDHNGLSTLILVKHYQLQDSFSPFAPKAFAAFLKGISIPSNIDELLKNDFCRRIPFNELATKSKVATNYAVSPILFNKIESHKQSIQLLANFKRSIK